MKKKTQLPLRRSQTLANGNELADLGGFIRGDGSEGTLGEVTGNMGDINLADNPFYSQFTNSIPLPAAERNRLAGIRQQIDTLNSRLAILERFNGSAFVTVGESGIMTGTGQSLARQNAVGGGYLFMQLNTGNQGLLEQSYTALKDSVYGGLVLQTRLKGYLDAISLTVDEGGVRMGFSANDNNYWRNAA